jgi:hypothetical protein
MAWREERFYYEINSYWGYGKALCVRVCGCNFDELRI